MQALAAVTSLLLSTGFLLLGHGMQLTLLPLRAADNGMPEYLIGLSASSYFTGFVIGCLAIPVSGDGNTGEVWEAVSSLPGMLALAVDSMGSSGAPSRALTCDGDSRRTS